MKLITRTKDLTKNMKWNKWEECQDADFLTQQECEGLVIGWADDHQVKWYGHSAQFTAPYMQHEFKIVEDEYCVETLNQITAGTYFSRG